MCVSTIVIFSFAAALTVCSFEVDNLSSTVRTDKKTAESEPSDTKISEGVKKENVDGGDTNGSDTESDDNHDDDDEDDNQAGLDTADKNAIEVMFGVSLLSLAFFLLLYICPPLCRQETKALHRRYIDTQLQIGEL